MRKRPPTLSTLRFVAALVCAAQLLSTGCGGGSVTQPSIISTNTNIVSTNSNGVTGVTGNWEFQLSYAQNTATGAIFSPPPPNSRIDLNLTQSDINASASALTSNATIKGADLGCKVGGDAWTTAGNAFGGFGPGPVFTLLSGMIQGPTITVVLNEADSSSPAHGQLAFTGLLNADGSLSGTVSDGCVADALGNPKQGTWTGSRIVNLP